MILGDSVTLSLLISRVCGDESQTRHRQAAIKLDILKVAPHFHPHLSELFSFFVSQFSIPPKV